MVRFLYIFILSAFSFLYGAACEQVLLFDADIVVHKDATLTVKEEITVRSCQQAIRHGILREFPTIYEDRLGNTYEIDFGLLEVLLNSQPVLYKVESKANGKHIYIGDPETYLPEGVYTFTLIYTVNRQLGFFDDHDELYWNVTGNGWRFPIAQVQARIVLPEGVDIAVIRAEGYTDGYGVRGKSLHADIARNGAIRFKTTHQLDQNEGFTIVVGWPKDVVTPPSLQQKIFWFFRDNLHRGFFLFGLIFLCGTIVYVYRRNRDRAGGKPTIPGYFN